jgi:hypothetical protein
MDPLSMPLLVALGIVLALLVIGLYAIYFDPRMVDEEEETSVAEESPYELEKDKFAHPHKDPAEINKETAEFYTHE